MSKRYSEIPTTEKHEHVWFGNLCGCGAVRVTYSEYQSRNSEYNNYYPLARKTESFALYEVMRGAILSNNGALVRECRAKAQEILAAKTFIPKPRFADPHLEKIHGRLVVV